MIDANLNRAAEALRVAEDVARFHWSLEGFARDLKGLRHELFGAVDAAGFRREDLLACRDTEGDVGKELASPQTASRGAPEVAFRNIERAKEALRVIEEAVRTAVPEAAAGMEKLRYRLYQVEKGLARLLPGPRTERLWSARLCLLATRALAARPLEDVVVEAIAGGVDVVELREKGIADRELLGTARAIREITARRDVLFIVNDRPDIALLAHADGVHVGQSDLPVGAVRSFLGDQHVVGVSTHSLEEARSAEAAGADYIGAGPVFRTTTKDAGPLLRPDGLRGVLAAVSVPAFAIGGISPANIEEAVRAGARKAAVSSAILSAADPGAVASTIRAALERGA